MFSKFGETIVGKSNPNDLSYICSFKTNKTSGPEIFPHVSTFMEASPLAGKQVLPVLPV